MYINNNNNNINKRYKRLTLLNKIFSKSQKAFHTSCMYNIML